MAQNRTDIKFGDQEKGFQIGTNYGPIHPPPGIEDPQIETLEREVTACQNDLFLTDPNADREFIINTKGVRVDGTCEWITHDGIYQSWLQGDTHLLWISGDPGKGKTMLSVFLIDELQRVGHEVIFYFCSHQEEKRDTSIAVLRILVYQIITKRPKLVKHVSPHLMTPARKEHTLSSLETLWIIFKTLIQDPDLGSMFCVLDGLDECDNDTLRKLVPRIVDLFSPEYIQSTSKAFKLVILSRDIPGLHGCGQLDGCGRVQLDSDNDYRVAGDIARFILVKIQELSRIGGFNDEFCRTIQEVLLIHAEGTFLWVGFVVNELSQKRTRIEVEEALCDLPKGLDAMYSRMLLQIERRRRRTTSTILKWVTMASRPLTLKELAAAADVKSSDLTTAERYVRDYVHLCGLFHKVRKRKVRLVHQSARDYLLRKEPDDDAVLEEFRFNPEAAHLELAQACLDCLAQSRLQYSSMDLDNKSCSQASPLLAYAAFEWSKHASRCSTLAEKLMDRWESFFFEKNSTLRTNWWESYQRARYVKPDTRSPLLMACWLGVEPWARALLEKKDWALKYELEEKDDYGLTALHCAVDDGHEAVVHLLIGHGADVNAKDDEGETVLHSAVKGGNKAVVRLLIDSEADVNVGNDFDSTPLHWAARKGNEAVVRLLIEGGADVDAENNCRCTPLHWAVRKGHEGVVRLLEKRGADVDAKNSDGFTALHLAVEEENEVVVQLLIELEADVDAKDPKRETALHSAAKGGNEALARLLIEGKAYVNAKDRYGWTPLLLAAREGHEAVVRLLVERGAKVNAMNRYKSTALDCAARKGHEAVVRLLKSAGAS